MTTATMRSLHRPRKNLVRCQICAVAVVLMTTATAQIWQRTRFFLGLCKLRIVALIVFTALVGMALATPGMIPLNALVWGTLGIGMASASAAAINHLLDERADRIMARTRNRPLPTHRVNRREALVFALALGIVSMLVLALLVNVLTAALTLVGLIGYAIVYTAWLKRATPQNIVIGGAAGAVPPLLGWTAVTGEVHAHALVLFLLIFRWPPRCPWSGGLATPLSTQPGSSAPLRKASSLAGPPAPCRPFWAGPPLPVRSTPTPSFFFSSYSSGHRRISGRWPSTAAKTTRPPMCPCCPLPTALRSPAGKFCSTPSFWCWSRCCRG